jgi:hypothetical protein
MRKRRVIVIDEKMERALTTLCDVAMKFAGMHMATIVADIANAINDEDQFLDDELEDEDW